MKYIPADKLIAEIEQRLSEIPTPKVRDSNSIENFYRRDELMRIKKFVHTLQQEQPIEGKQVIIITETDGEANIHWDCRSLDDVRTLLTSAESFIADKQIEELRGQGSAPDYNTTEGRFRNAHKFQREQPKVDYRALLYSLLEAIDYSFVRPDGTYPVSLTYPVIDKVQYIKGQLSNEHEKEKEKGKEK